jgi:tetratricopeptide (TPR) repeat protein
VADFGPKRSYTREEVCRLLKLREALLEDWEAHGFVSRLETYAFRDLVALKTLRQLRRARYSAERIRLILSALRERLRHVKDPLTDLKIFTDGRKLAVQVDGQKMEALSGQLLLDFDQEEIRRLLSFPGRRADETLAEQVAQRQREARTWFERGVEMEQNGTPAEQVIVAYKKALEFDAEAAGAWVNLGTVYFNLKRWREAEQHYRMALEKKPGYALALYNLGNLFDETGEWSQALDCYLQAIEKDESYADAHYNIALLYQNQGEALKALKHWRAYLKIDPSGYWAGIARRELSRLRQESLVVGRSGG